MKRQGDVLIVKIDRADTGKDVSENGRIVLAHGEATGHCHVVEAPPEVKMKLIESVNGNRYLTIEGGEAQIVHPEHGAVTLAPGDYRVIRQTEWTDENEPRQVAD